MRNLVCILLALFASVAVSAQKVYFMYLQAENGSPFYVKLGDRIHSSSSSGYLILSNLADSNHRIHLGFASSGKEYRYQVPLNGKDRGFLIKKFDFGTGLFDLQSLSIIRPEADESAKLENMRRRTDEFSLLLSKASRDTSLLWVVMPVKQDVAISDPKPDENLSGPQIERPAIDSVTNVVNNALPHPDSISKSMVSQSDDLPDSTGVAVLDVQEELNDPVKKEPVDSLIAQADEVKQDLPFNEENPPVLLKEESAKSVVRKYAESSTSEGFGLVFFDSHENGTDTIRILIPNPPVVFKNEAVVLRDEAPEEEKKFLDISSEAAEQVIRDSVQQGADTTQARPLIISGKETKESVNDAGLPKPVCPDTATDDDFLKLRRYMAAEITDEAMVDVAKKYFREKCFTTEQVKNLGALFLTSAGKYIFYDAAYMHVSDREKFPSLGEGITDDYYQKRFKALIGQ